MKISDIEKMEQLLKEVRPLKEQIKATRHLLNELDRGSTRKIQISLLYYGPNTYINLTPSESKELSSFLRSYLDRKQKELDTIKLTLNEPYGEKNIHDIFEEKLNDIDLSDYLKKYITNNHITRIGYMIPKINALFGLDLPEDEMAFVQYLAKHYRVRIVWAAGAYIEMYDPSYIMKIK